MIFACSIIKHFVTRVWKQWFFYEKMTVTMMTILRFFEALHKLFFDNFISALLALSRQSGLILTHVIILWNGTTQRRPRNRHLSFLWKQITSNFHFATGLTVFRGISAVDLDKPNTANSDVVFSIVDGNDDGKFALESSHNPALIIKKNLDYDAGDHEFKLKIMASVSHLWSLLYYKEDDMMSMTYPNYLYQQNFKCDGSMLKPISFNNTSSSFDPLSMKKS